jgi:hypothetical protein
MGVGYHANSAHAFAEALAKDSLIMGRLLSPLMNMRCSVDWVRDF